MFSTLSQWIQGLVIPLVTGEGGVDLEIENPPEHLPPTIAAQRLDRYPDGSEEAYGALTVESPFFQRLPPDIRRMILIAAWGNRIVHVDLRYGLPLAGHPWVHGHDPRISHSSRTSRTRDWQWYGCVCHQQPGWRVRKRSSRDDFIYEPRKDTCLSLDDIQKTLCCDDWLGEIPLKCRVGALGWLRSCRRAYMEGVEVLYGTNEFKFSGTTLFRNLDRPRLRPEHLALITSAEIRFDLGQVARPPQSGMDLSHDKRFSGWYDFLSILKNIPDALPNLRYMHITPAGYWFPPQMARNDIFKLTDSVMFEPFDAMVQTAFSTNKRLEDVHVAIPSAMLATRATRISASLQGDSDSKWHDLTRLWRPIGSKNGESASRNEEPGYWISIGPHHGPALHGGGD